MDKNVQDIKLLKRIEDIGLPESIASDLRWHGNIKTLKQLIQTDVVDLLKIYGIGEKKVNIIIAVLNEIGLSLVDSRIPKVVSESQVSVINIDFPYNLFAYISHHTADFQCPEEVTQDIIDGIHIACLSLNERQQAILYLRFECQQTLDKIATRFSLSSTQIQNIINNSISDWFKTGDIQYIEFGLKGYINRLVIAKVKLLVGETIIKEYKRGYEDGYNASHGNVIEKSMEVCDTPIEKLNLNIRSYNCIKRAGIDTVEDLICKTEDDMMKVRNLGRSGLDEIRTKLCEIGLSFKDSELIDYAFQENYKYYVKQIVFEKTDEAMFLETKKTISVDCYGRIIATDSISDGYENRYCTYDVSDTSWSNFIDEAIIIDDIVNWTQEKFASLDLENLIHNDISYSVEFFLQNKTIRFTGSESSKGVQLVKELFSKYFSLPNNIKYTVEKTENKDWF